MTRQMGQVNVEKHQPHELADSGAPRARNLAVINRYSWPTQQEGLFSPVRPQSRAEFAVAAV
jgi:hypothetical protein